MEKVKKHFAKIQQDFDKKLKLVQESTPDFTKFQNGYTGQLKSIVKELESDPALANIIASM